MSWGEDDSTPKEKRLFAGLLITMGFLTYALMTCVNYNYDEQRAKSMENMDINDTVTTLPPRGLLHQKSDTIINVCPIQTERRRVRHYDDQEFEDAMEDYLESNPDAIDRYLDR